MKKKTPHCYLFPPINQSKDYALLYSSQQLIEKMITCHINYQNIVQFQLDYDPLLKEQKDLLYELRYIFKNGLMIPNIVENLTYVLTTPQLPFTI